MSALSYRTKAIGFVGLAAIGLTALPALAQGAVSPNYRWLTFAVFAAIIGMTMFVTFLAARSALRGAGPSQRRHGMIAQRAQQLQVPVGQHQAAGLQLVAVDQSHGSALVHHRQQQEGRRVHLAPVPRRQP